MHLLTFERSLLLAAQSNISAAECDLNIYTKENWQQEVKQQKAKQTNNLTDWNKQNTAKKIIKNK